MMGCALLSPNKFGLWGRGSANLRRTSTCVDGILSPNLSRRCVVGQLEFGRGSVFLRGYTAKGVRCAFIVSWRAGFWRSNPRSCWLGIASSPKSLLAMTGRSRLRHLACQNHPGLPVSWFTGLLVVLIVDLPTFASGSAFPAHDAGPFDLTQVQFHFVLLA